MSVCRWELSSRRRHTRLQGDWSSDVCSSDLYPRLLKICPPARLPQPLKSPCQLTESASPLYKKATESPSINGICFLFSSSAQNWSIFFLRLDRKSVV